MHMHRAFTLVEVLVALAITGGLLAGVGIVITQLRTGREALRTPSGQAQARRALQVVEQDVRGLVAIGSLPAERDRRGEPVAAFRTTWRVDALADGVWAGSSIVSYWHDPSSDLGTLWRTESAGGADGAVGWTPLADGVDSVAVELLVEGEWRAWPSGTQEEEATDEPALHPQAVKVSLRRVGETAGSKGIIERVFPTMLLGAPASAPASKGARG
jgi:prepilin-type N-terminal cleavage/methylation domain-containing protein